MMSAPMFSMGMMELLVLLSSAGVVGLPPGDRDPALLRSAPADVIYYAEWASRGAGQPGGKGIDGLAADPEIRAFLRDIGRVVTAQLDKQVSGIPVPELQTAAKILPLLLLKLSHQPGSLSVRFEKPPPEAAGGFGPIAMLKNLRATLIVSGGRQADSIATEMTKLLNLAPIRTEGKPLDRQTIPLPIPGLTLTLHRHKTYFIIGLGKGAIEAAVSGIDGTSQRLAGNVRFARAMKQVAMKRTATMSWIDVKGLEDRIFESVGILGLVYKTMIASLGLDSVDSIASSTGVINHHVRTRRFINTGGQTRGVLAIASGRGLQPADFSRVPADADFVLAVSLNGPKMLAAVKKIVAVAAPKSRKALRQSLKQLDQDLGISLERDFFPAFGDVWILHNSKSAGGLFVTSLVGSLEVRDRQKAKLVFDKITKLIAENVPGVSPNGRRQRGVELKHRTFLKQTIYYFNTIGDGDIPFAPAFCLTDKELLVAPHPQAIKAHLRFLADGKPDFTSRLKKEIPRGEGDLLAVYFLESKALIRYLYAFAPYLGQMVLSELQGHGADIDLFSLPSARAVLPYAGNSFGTLVRTKQGLRFDSQNGLPLPGVGIVPIFGTGFIKSSRHRRPAGVAPIRIQLNAVPRRRLNKRVKTDVPKRPVRGRARVVLKTAE